MAHKHDRVSVLLDRVAGGDQHAIHELFEIYRDRLRQMITLRLDAKLARRIDASDVIQEALINAAERLPQYVETRPIQFYPWLWQIASERLIDAKRRHGALKRDVKRECELPLTDDSINQFAAHFASGSKNAVSNELERQENKVHVQVAMQGLSAISQQILCMRYMEGMKNNEIADALSMTVSAVKSQHSRALTKLGAALRNAEIGGGHSE